MAAEHRTAGTRARGAGARTVPAILAVVALAAACGSGGQAGGAPDGTGASGTGGDVAAEATTTSTSPPTTRALRSFTVLGVGDILLHDYVIREGRANAGGQGHDFTPMFADVKSRISAADLAICHQETPISADNTQLTVPKTLSFNAPHEIAAALKDAGFDGCDTASNHTWDRGLKGVRQTLDVLDAAGLGHAGSARSAEESNTHVYDVKGVKVGHLAYSYTIDNSGGPTTHVPADAPWLQAMLWPAVGVEGILAQARALKQQGAEFVVMSVHWGDQYVHQPNGTQRQMAQELLASPDIDLILGDHVHVVQPCEKINGKYVIYGMGNFLSNQSPSQDKSLAPDNEDGTISTFTVQEVSPGTFRTTGYVYTPTRVVIPGHRIVPATPAAAKPSYDRTVQSMGLLGPGGCDAQPEF
jgi:hypothetical protein